VAGRLSQFLRIRRSEPPVLTEVAPAFALELEGLLRRKGQAGLAASVGDLRVVELCPCGDPECSSFYVASSFVVRWRWRGHGETLKLLATRGTVSIDLIDREIVLVEALDRPDLAKSLLDADLRRP
jgi:hypothetical protein